MVTSRDVARVAGVSQATVSRVMSAHPALAPETRAKVLAAMDSLGYVPHAGAQAMKTRRSNVIGVVVAGLSNPFYTEILDALTRELDAAGQRVVVWNAGGGSHLDALKAIRERAVDGVVFTTATPGSVELEAAVRQQSPIVLINRVVDGLDCDKVASTNYAGGGLVADYLRDHERTTAAFIGADSTASTSRDRGSGFLDRMRAHGHPVHARSQFRGEYSHAFGAATMTTLLARRTPPTAVFCANDQLAFGALDALRQVGKTTTDCWVIGYDDLQMSSWAAFDLTTVRQPTEELARAGVELLLQRVKTPEAPTRTVEFPCQLIVRGSTPG